MTRDPLPGRETLRRELRAAANPAHARVAQSFFKTGPGEYGEGDRFLGIRLPACKHAARMPRTMLRYAIEKFPADLRRTYLEIH